MTTQPEALRLAELIDWPSVKHGSEAASELRRLHEANKELLEALQEVVAAADGTGWNQIDPSFKKQRATINKHGEKK